MTSSSASPPIRGCRVWRVHLRQNSTPTAPFGSPERGLMTQWVHVYESNDKTFDTIVATFTGLFPYTSGWSPEGGDVILIGSQNRVGAQVRRPRDNS